MRKTFTAALFAFVLLAGTAFAGQKGSLNVPSDTTIGGTKVAAGDYKVEWTDDGQVTLSRNGKQVAKTKATVEKGSKTGSNGGVVNRTAADGSKQAIELHVKDSVLKLDQSAGTNGEVVAVH